MDVYLSLFLARRWCAPFASSTACTPAYLADAIQVVSEVRS